MYVQTCWQCGAKNQIDEGRRGGVVCEQCGAELPTFGDAPAADPWPRPARARSPLAGRLSSLSWSHVILAVNVVVFIVMVAGGVHPLEPTAESLYRWGSDFGPDSLGGEPWRLVTAMFLHSGLVHLALNMYVLSSIGPLTERLFGRAGFLALYLLSGVGGSLASINWQPEVVSVGASGAIFGLFGGLLGLLVTQRDAFPADFVRSHMASIAVFLGYSLLFGAAVPGINNAAHLGGLATGFVFAAAVRPDFSARRRAGARQLAGLALVLALLGGAAYTGRRRSESAPEARLQRVIFSASRIEPRNDKVVYFLGAATRDDAERLAADFQTKGLFDKSGGSTVFLSKGERGYEVSVYGGPGSLTDTKGDGWWALEATDLSADVFGGQPVTIHRCNELFVPVRSIRSGGRFVWAPDREIYYRGGVTGEEAEGLGRVLGQLGVGEGSDGVDVELTKDEGGYEVRFLVGDGTWDDAEAVGWYGRFAARLSREVFGGQPVRVVLADTHGAPRKTIPATDVKTGGPVR